MAQQSYARDRKRIILLQSCVRRHQAKKELQVLRHEARSVVHFKEVSYKLENKVVELTQSLQKRTFENKELQTKLRTLEQQLQSWMAKFDDADSKAKLLHAEAQKPTVALPEFEALDAQKRTVDIKLEESLKKITIQDATILKLNEDFVRQTQEMEDQQANHLEVIASTTEDTATVASLRTEVSSLRDQLTRQVSAANQAKVRPEGGAFNMATGRVAADTIATAAGGAIVVNALNGTPKRRSPPRNGDAGMDINGTSEDEKYDTPRTISGVVSQDAIKRLPGGKEYVADVYDDPAEEIMKLLEDEEPLDEDVLSGIIRHLKVPSPNLQNPPTPKEVLFPAHLISLVTNEMWKYGMMRESERFLANVMQTIQQHVMVSLNQDNISHSEDTNIIISLCAGLSRRRCHCSRNLLAFECS